MSVVKNPHHRTMIWFGLQTGLRREEIATFPLAYIFDPDKSAKKTGNFKITLDPYDGHGICTKGKKSRIIHISRKFLSILYRYVVQVRGERASLTDNKHKQLFLNQFGQPYAVGGKGIERIVRELGKRANIKVHTHMLRHTYATHTLSHLQKSREGIEPFVYLQGQLGHESINTTMIYAHLLNELADKAVLAYDDELNEDWEKS